MTFKEYRNEVEQKVPNLNPTELYILKQYYKGGVSIEDAIVNMFDFGYSDSYPVNTSGDFIKYNPDFEFEER